MLLYGRFEYNRGLDYDYPSADPRFAGPGEQNVAYWGLVRADSPNVPLPANVLPGDAGVNTVQNVTQAPDVNRTPISTWSNNWHWVHLGSIYQINLNTYYRLYFYAGSAGYSLDRIIITDSPAANSNNSAQDGAALGSARTAPATVSSAYRTACDYCNRVYAANIITPAAQCTFHADGSYLDAPDFELGVINAANNALHPIFDEWEMHMRDAKEADKGVILNKEMSPQRDQVGLVYYSSAGLQKTNLSCKRAAQTQGIPCDPDDNAAAYSNVLNAVESLRAQGGTPTAYGLREGLEVFGLNGDSAIDMNCDGAYNSSCARSANVQRALILMTDGMPNSTAWGYGCTSSTAPLWPDNNNASNRCPLYYAYQAAQNGISVYVLGQGFGLDTNWLRELAWYGKGVAYVNVSPDELDRLFATIRTPRNPAYDFSVNVAPLTQNVAPGNTGVYTIALGPAFTSPVTLTLSSVPPGVSSNFSLNPLPSTAQSALTLTTVSTLTQRYHFITITADDGVHSRESYLVLNAIP